MKSTTTDTARWKLVDAQRALQEWLEGHPDVREPRRHYIPADQRATADPEAVRGEQVSKQLQSAIRQLQLEVGSGA